MKHNYRKEPESAPKESLEGNTSMLKPDYNRPEFQPREREVGRDRPDFNRERPDFNRDEDRRDNWMNSR